VKVTDEGSQPPHRRIFPDIFTDEKPTYSGAKGEFSALTGIVPVSALATGAAVGDSVSDGVAVKPEPIKVGVPVKVGVGSVGVMVGVSLGVT
jgi:hypothetical protein